MKISALGHQNWGMTHDARRALEARMESLDALVARGMDAQPAGASLTDKVRAAFNGGNTVIPEIVGDVATVEIIGDIIARAPWYAKAYMDAVDPFDVAETFDALAGNAAVKRVVIEMDSCGGTIAGTAEALAAMVRLQAAGKSVEVHAAGVIASAAFWMVCAADRIVATSTTHVGSLGVYNLLCDDTGAQRDVGVRLETITSAAGKGLGADGAITPAQREQTQRRVDALLAVFRDAVGGNRGLTGEKLDAVFTGETWLAAQAVSLGLIDAVAAPAEVADAPDAVEPAPEIVVPLITKPGSPEPSAKASPTQAVSAASESIMDKQIQAALAALTKAHPTQAAALVEFATSKDGLTVDALKAHAAELVAKATADELNASKAKVTALEAKAASDATEAKRVADELAALKGNAQGTDPGVGDPKATAVPSMTGEAFLKLSADARNAHRAKGGLVDGR